MTIDAADRRRSGYYKVKATNKFDSHERSILLRVYCKYKHFY